MTYALGVDVGATHTAAAVWRDGRALPAVLRPLDYDIPSVLYLEKNGTRLVGEAAVRRSAGHSDRTARRFKRHLGADAVRLAGADVPAEELVADMIRFAAGRVAEHEGGPPAHVTLTCPARWGPAQQALMERAAGLAGLESVGLVPEPIAAAVSHAAGAMSPSAGVRTGALLGVYDLGGGTFGATVVRKTIGGFEVCGRPGGLDDVGGVTFDEVVYEEVVRASGPALSGLRPDDRATARHLAQVRAGCERAKEALSSQDRARVTVVLPHFSDEVTVTRPVFESGITPALSRTVSTFTDTVHAAGYDLADLSLVLLVGGSSRIPLVSRLLARALPPTVRLEEGSYPELATCLGAAITAGTRVSKSKVPPDAHIPSQSAHVGSVPRARGVDRIAVRNDRTAEPRHAGPVPPDVAAGASMPVISVDRVAAGIGDLLDVPLAPDVAPRTHPLLADSETLTIRTGHDAGYGRSERLYVVLIVLAVALVLFLAWLLAVLSHR
jgi:molecular chaperone DnaK (HSP70)